MSIDADDIVVTIDAKRMVAIGLLAVISIYTLYSYSIALFAFIAPYNGEYPLDVLDEAVTDTSNVALPGNTATTGQTVRVHAKVEYGQGYWSNPPPDYSSYTSFSATETYIVFITIKGPNDNVIKFYSDTGSLTPGQFETYNVDTTLSSSAASGTYTVQVLVWSEALPDGIVQAPTLTEMTFDV